MNYLKKELYQLIREEAQIFDFIQDFALDGMWYWDLKNPKSMWINPKFWKTLGYNTEEMPHESKVWQSVMLPEDLIITLDNIKKYCEDASHPFQQTVRFIHKNGQIVWTQCKGFAIRDKNGKATYLLGTHIDISQQRESELALEERIARYRHVIEGADIGTWESNIKTGEVIINSKFANLIGYDLSEIPSVSIDFWKQIVNPDDFEIVIQLIQLHLEGKTPFFEAEFRLITKNGNTIWVLSKGKITNWAEDGSPLWLTGFIQDTSNRRNREQLLVKYQNLLEKTNEAARIGTWEVIMEPLSTSLSKITKEIYEVPEDFEAKVEEGMAFYKEGEHRDKIAGLFTACVEKGEKYDTELILVTAKGNERWVRTIGIPVFTDGKCSMVYGTFQDIHEQKIAELALIEERQRLNNVIEAANLGTWEWNIQTGEVIVNDRWAEIIGHKLERLGPISIDALNKFMDKEYLSKNIEVLEAHFRGEKDYYHFEALVNHRNGHWIWVLDRGKVISWTEAGQALLMYGTRQEITDVKKLEQELLSNVNKFQGIYDLSPVGIALSDLESGFFIDFNQALVNSTGYTYNEFKRLSYIDLTPEEYREQDLQQITEIIETGKYGPYEKEYIRKDGSRYPVLMNGVFFTNEAGKKVVLSIIQDISEQKKQENELIYSKELAESASRAKSEFLANMSHEIRTPLNGVIGFTDLLMKTPLSETQHQYMSTVYQSANSLLDLINDILDFSKIEAGKLELNFEKTDLISLGEQIANISKYQAYQNGVELILNIAPSLPRFIWTDAIRLRQILVNLMSNATKFTDKGEVELKIELLEQKDDSSAGFRFSVRDTGIGIAKANQQKIFEAFSQEDSSISKKFGGTGLGLSITNKLLYMMGSKLQLNSSLGAGSTFFFDVQFKTENESTEETYCLEHLKKILVVDDNARNRALLVEMLESQGIEVFEVKSGALALKKIAEEDIFDAVLIDYNMPNLNGLETAHKICKIANLTRRELPIFLMINSNDEKVETADTFEKIIHLSKPVHPIKLFKALSTKEELIDSSSNIVVVEEKLEEKSSLQSQELKVLIAEDNPVNMMLIKHYFQKIDHKVELLLAENGQVALELYNQHLPNMVITDIQMPIMNGYELSKAIRASESGESVPIIAITAGAIMGEKERCLEVGMNDYLSKPILEKTLRESVLKWLYK